MDLVEHGNALEEAAIAALLEAKAIEYCPAHGDVWMRLGDEDAESRAYAIATNRWKSGDLICEREELMDAIKEVLDQAADDECPECGEIADA